MRRGCTNKQNTPWQSPWHPPTPQKQQQQHNIKNLWQLVSTGSPTTDDILKEMSSKGVCCCTIHVDSDQLCLNSSLDHWVTVDEMICCYTFFDTCNCSKVQSLILEINFNILTILAYLNQCLRFAHLCHFSQSKTDWGLEYSCRIKTCRTKFALKSCQTNMQVT